MNLGAFHGGVLLLEEVGHFRRQLRDSVLSAAPAALVERRRRMLLVRVGRVIEGCKRVERRGPNAGPVHGLMVQQSELARLEEQSGVQGKEGAKFPDGTFEVQLVQERYNMVDPECCGEISLDLRGMLRTYQRRVQILPERGETQGSLIQCPQYCSIQVFARTYDILNLD